MIRLILVAIGILIVWVLFLSDFSKRQKIIICIAAVVLSVAGLWFEQYSQTPKDGVILANELVDCGVTSNYSYRTNYDIEFCLRNTSPSATAKRVSISFIVLNCTEGTCDEIQVIDKGVPLTLSPGEEAKYKENISFDKIDSPADSLVWVVKVNTVKALD